MIFHAADTNMWALLLDMQRAVRELREWQEYREDQIAEVLKDKMDEALLQHMGDILEEHMGDILQEHMGDILNDGISELEQKVDDLKDQMNRVEQMSAVVSFPFFFSERRIEMSADVQ